MPADSRDSPGLLTIVWWHTAPLRCSGRAHVSDRMPHGQMHTRQFPPLNLLTDTQLQSTFSSSAVHRRFRGADPCLTDGDVLRSDVVSKAAS